jgi:hypothetical protein
MTWNLVRFGGSDNPVFVNPVTPISFVSGVKLFFQFEPHQGMDASIPGPIERRMPDGLYPMTFFGDNDGFEITAASVELSGNHYYVPEPSTMVVMSVFGGFLGLYRKRKAKTVSA